VPRSLHANCAECFGLCCVVPAFSASADFAIDKAAGTPCPNLAADFHCGIHDTLRVGGFPGCTAYDCFGAGQQVSQVTFGGRDWRSPDVARSMFAVFPVVFQLHQLLAYLTAARELEVLRTEILAAIEDTERLAEFDPESLMQLDVAAHRDRVNQLLRRVSETVRQPAGRSLRGADLVAADLAEADLRAADLRGASLIGANLTGADLRRADVTGADCRNADLAGADLTDVLFLTQAQLDSARGDRRTRLPAAMNRPAHW
jgi:uncharacterized protein YjbI with pentapeptide repeats